MTNFGDTWKRAEATPQSTPRPYVVREERRLCESEVLSDHNLPLYMSK